MLVFQIRTRDGHHCVDSMGGDYKGGLVALYPCHGIGNNQLFLLKEHGQICQRNRCAWPNKNGVKMDSMLPAGLDGEWSYDEVGIKI